MELSLDKHQAGHDPFALFTRWFEEANDRQQTLPESMALATVDKNGQPSVRVVLLKSHDANGFVFFTNYESEKGRQLAAHPKAAAVFHWAFLQRQVRVEGAVEKVSDEESDAYFQTRPWDSQIGAWASPQSQVIANRAALERKFEEVAKRWSEGATPPRPRIWGGYRLVPMRIEFWQGRAHRLHDRIVFSRKSLRDDWRVERLAP